MGFKEYFLANEFMLKGIRDLKVNPLVPTGIPKSGLRSNVGAAKMSALAPSKPYKPKPYDPKFRMGKSSLKS